MAVPVRCWSASGFSGCKDEQDGWPRITNEGQHQRKMWPWAATTRSFALQTGVNWPVYTPQGASLRQIATAVDRAPAIIACELKRHTSRQQGYQPRYAQTTHTQPNRAWRHYLPRAKWRRGLPRKTALVTVSADRFTELLPLYNKYAPQVLGLPDPSRSVLAGTCESTKSKNRPLPGERKLDHCFHGTPSGG